MRHAVGFRIACALLCFAASSEGLLAQSGAPPQSFLIVPFENRSSAPGLQWISEAFPEILSQRLASSGRNILDRQERRRAFDRAGLQTALQPTRASIFRVADDLDTSYVVLGNYRFDGQTFTATAQLLDIQRTKLMPEVRESGPLPQLINLQTALAWDLLRQLEPNLIHSREAFIASAAPIRLDALENYIRGILASSPEEKIRHYREALRLNPNYTEVAMALGQTHFSARQYEAAATWLAKVPPTQAEGSEALFLLGLANYYLGQFERAENAFAALAERVPLPEVYNNLGVMQSRRGRKSAVENFQKAALADRKNADYHFNVAVASCRNSDISSCARQLRETIALHDDSETKALLESLTAANQVGKLPLERIRHNFDGNAFRQLAWQLEASTELRMANAEPGKHAQFHTSQGQQLLTQGFAGEAERNFREAVALDPSNNDAHAGLARTLESRNELADARREAELAFRQKPTADMWLLLARLDLHDNRIEEAAQKIDHALELEPSNQAAASLRRTVASKLATQLSPTPEKSSPQQP